MGPRSGAEIRAKFESGSPVSWRLNRDQARLLVTLPKHLGGWIYQVVLEGGYTFTPTLTDKRQVRRPDSNDLALIDARRSSQS